jgi:hypothetical protein
LLTGRSKAPREALPWPSAQGQAEMMHNTLQPRRAAAERTRGILSLLDPQGGIHQGQG